MNINVKDLEKLVDLIKVYVVSSDKSILEKNQDLILAARDADYSAKTQKEFDNQSKFDESSHGIGRMIMFLLNHYGEHYLDGGELTIFVDDPKVFSSAHDNIYRLALKDADTHDNFGDEYNPTAEDKPYDFDSRFIKQTTRYSDDNTVDTTATAWDSFQKAYTTPTRTFDFKSAFWKSGHEHFVNYILQIDSNLNLHVINRITKEEKQFNFIALESHKGYLDKYKSMLNTMYELGDYAWSNFILPPKK